MKQGTRKIKWLLVAAFTLLSVAALSIPSTVCAFGFCESCQEQCREEGAQIYLQCRAQGNDVNTCLERNWEYNKACNAMFCSGCGPIHD